MKTVLFSIFFTGLFGVILGAFGGHYIKLIMNPDLIPIFETANRYQFYHTFASLFSIILYKIYHDKFFKISAIIFLIGIFLFSGSLYLLSITGIKTFGAITPFGGICFIIGWGILCWRSTKLV